MKCCKTISLTVNPEGGLIDWMSLVWDNYFLGEHSPDPIYGSFVAITHSASDNHIEFAASAHSGATEPAHTNNGYFFQSGAIDFSGVAQTAKARIIFNKTNLEFADLTGNLVVQGQVTIWMQDPDGNGYEQLLDKSIYVDPAQINAGTNDFTINIPAATLPNMYIQILLYTSISANEFSPERTFAYSMRLEMTNS